MTASTDKTQKQNLDAVRKEAQEALASAEKNDVQARYKVAVIVCKVTDEAMYGENALDVLEDELRLAYQTLYRYARVGAAWTEQEFHELSKRKNALGIPLTWSHYELLAELKDAEARKAMIENVLVICHTSRALNQEIRAAKRESKKAKSGTEMEAPKAVIKEFASLVKTIGSIGKEAAAWEEESLPTLKAIRNQLSKKDLKSLRDAQKRMEEIKDTLDRLADEVEDVLESSQETTSTVTADAA